MHLFHQVWKLHIESGWTLLLKFIWMSFILEKKSNYHPESKNIPPLPGSWLELTKKKTGIQRLKSQIGCAKLALANISFCLCSGPMVQHICIALQASIHPGPVNNSSGWVFLSHFQWKSKLLTGPGGIEDCSAMYLCWTIVPLLYRQEMFVLPIESGIGCASCMTLPPLAGILFRFCNNSSDPWGAPLLTKGWAPSVMIQYSRLAVKPMWFYHLSKYKGLLHYHQLNSWYMYIYQAFHSEIWF